MAPTLNSAQGFVHAWAGPGSTCPSLHFPTWMKENEIAFLHLLLFREMKWVIPREQAGTADRILTANAAQWLRLSAGECAPAHPGNGWLSAERQISAHTDNPKVQSGETETFPKHIPTKLTDICRSPSSVCAEPPTIQRSSRRFSPV